MTTTYDLAPAAAQVARLADGVNHDQLDSATPCEDWTVALLLDHLLGLTAAFTAAANKTPLRADTTELDGRLPSDWKVQLHERLDALVAAWNTPEAWQGEAEAGGVVMPAETMGVVALDELVLHGWDLARATGQAFHADPVSVTACLNFAAAMSEPGQEADREGLYGPVVPVPADAPDLERLLGLTGRDPQWTPA
ncbi:TIGR03086 family metal-binding protein [Actinopolyspora mortivallis]|uniref:TIGR03086 family metal-binding protein n=1 Tax=Actinopolyspora mortivallis TaxID=33906 RepID=UPI000369CF17|nr:TIGR03086 family metal-binding protein [Actinopolyspora mortivallis]